MRRIFIICLSLIFVVSSIDAQKKSKEKTKAPEKHKELKTQLDSVSYALGVAIGNTIQNGGLADINLKLFNKAMEQSIAQEETWIKKDTVEAIITAYLKKVEEKKGDKNLAEAKKFLEENKKKSGVIELPSGLQYKVIKEGTGPKPSQADKVTVHYHGTLISGKVFDSSIDRGEPIQLEVGRVIKGWTEALQLMGVGSKWVLYIHPDLGYGNRSMPGSPIEANSLLIFEVELISIDKQEPKEGPAFQDMLNK
jgi:FKBP-type peptidyl-prolyl cis-trans isomerase FklB